MKRIGVAVLGATGAVGQRFVSILANHPWFEVRAVVGQQSAGKTYASAAPWMLDTPLPPAVGQMRVRTVAALQDSDDVGVVFGAMPGGVAGPIESGLVRRGAQVFTNASDHRMDSDVPLLIPEVNPDHLALVERQKGPGWIVANGNCTAIVLTLALAPLYRTFGLDEVHVTSMQALSGAGYPGVSALDIEDNVLPHIAGEEEKLAAEPCKTLGRLAKGGIEPLDLPIHATCTRVAVREGHFESVHVRLAKRATAAAVAKAFAGFRGPEEVRRLPSAPKRPIHIHAAPDRPQPRRDRDLEGGMAVSVGRIRLDADGRGLRFVALGSNTVRGAAGASILNAELARARGLLDD